MGSAVPTPRPVAERTVHPFLTHDMIHEIPDAVRETLRRNAEPAARAAEAMADRRFLYFTGCGTAFYSAMLGQRLSAAEGHRGIRSEAVPALELSGYPGGLDRDCGVVGVSHSGITKATVDALQSARDRGAHTVGVTHFAGRPISAAADTTVVVGNGPDRSRCHTKCYLTGALGSAMVGMEWAVAAGGSLRKSIEDRMAAMGELPSLQAQVLRDVEKTCEELAAAHLGRRNTFIAGSGPNEANALETALKLKETSFIAAEGMETEQFIHGPTQVLDPDGLVLVLAPKGPAHARSLDLIRAARTIGAHVIAVAAEGDGEVGAHSEETITVPEVDEFLSPFLNIIPLYLYAYYASVKRGHNPDVLRYLEPGYWTARQVVFPPGTH